MIDALSAINNLDPAMNQMKPKGLRAEATFPPHSSRLQVCGKRPRRRKISLILGGNQAKALSMGSTTAFFAQSHFCYGKLIVKSNFLLSRMI
jgi:hypothetical protein